MRKTCSGSGKLTMDMGCKTEYSDKMEYTSTCHQWTRCTRQCTGALSVRHTKKERVDISHQI